MDTPLHSKNPSENHSADITYQDRILQDVSRTFALTIPQLPEDLRVVVGNAYLLCRIADTIEDSETLPMEEKRRCYGEFVDIVAGARPVGDFGDLTERLTGSTLEAERDLIRSTGRVIRLTHSFSDADREALHRCVRIMAQGMEQFQAGRFQLGLDDLAHLDAYCYHVAGVVGEMLTALFCAHSPAVAERQRELERLSVSFGQGLQMTNILKDVWADKERDMCWLPRDVFMRHGIDLAQLQNGKQDAAFEVGMRELVGVAHGHLRNALDYTLLIPPSEPGIRKFCLWALGMAVLTLRKIHRNPGYRSGDEVKISRRSVKTVILASTLFARNDTMLRTLFRAAPAGLPRSIGQDLQD